MTTNLNTFTGEYSYTVDSKGRVNIPAKFRKALSADNEDKFFKLFSIFFQTIAG